MYECVKQTVTDANLRRKIDMRHWTLALLIFWGYLGLVLLAAVICDEKYDAKLVKVINSKARCLDGSPPAYYVRRGTGSGSQKWFVYFEGGGWSMSYDNSLERAKTILGSSKSYEVCETAKSMKFYKSADPSQNPLMHNWNVVHIRYCDSSSYSGDAELTHKVSLY